MIEVESTCKIGPVILYFGGSGYSGRHPKPYKLPASSGDRHNPVIPVISQKHLEDSLDVLVIREGPDEIF